MVGRVNGSVRSLDQYEAGRQQIAAPIEFLIVDPANPSVATRDRKVLWCPACAKRTPTRWKQPIDVIAASHAERHGAPSWSTTHGTVPAAPRRKISPEKRARVMDRDGRACVWCGSADRLCIDHVVPLARGGSNDAENLRVLCWDCNTAKADKLDSEVR